MIAWPTAVGSISSQEVLMWLRMIAFNLSRGTGRTDHAQQDTL